MGILAVGKTGISGWLKCLDQLFKVELFGSGTNLNELGPNLDRILWVDQSDYIRVIGKRVRLLVEIRAGFYAERIHHG